MPKRKANWWPPSILADPDVLSVDDEGRFVLCKICHVHYAVHGGKKPKPVIMNSNFRTRAWDVHKERTNSHRMQKRLQQAKAQQTQGQQTTDTQQQQEPPEKTPQKPQQSTQGQEQRQQNQKKQPGQQQTQSQRTEQSQAPQTPVQSQSVSALATQAQTLTQTPPRQVQGQALATSAPLTQRQMQHQSPPRTPLQSQNDTQVQQQQQQQRRRLQQDLEETKGTDHESLQVPARNSANERPVNTARESITAPTMSGDSRTHDSGVMNNVTGKRPASTVPDGAPAQRRRVFRAGMPGSSMQLLAESELARRTTTQAHEKHSFMAPGPGNNAKKAASEHSVAMEQQADSSARWRHMHDDVSRALNAAPRRRQQGPASYTSGELRAAKTLAQTETGDLGSNNSERVAKKLRSLNAEYHASNMRHADAYNMRHSEAFDRRSARYKEYWGTLRDVYTSSGTTSGGSGNTTSHRKSHHRSGSSSLKQTAREESKETEADSTTPDDSGSSEDAFKPVVVVHDASLISAIERLTDATSKQITSLYEKQTSDTQDTLTGLTSVMTDLRVQHGNAIGRIIELQEKHLKVMQSILEVKLRKEAARNGKPSSCSNGSTTGSSSGSSPDSTSSGASRLSNPAQRSVIDLKKQQSTFFPRISE